MKVIDLGLVDYREAYQTQKKMVQAVIDGHEPVLFSCQHPLVLTMGRMTKQDSLLVDALDLEKQAVTIEKIDRGGDITLHNPGQLVMYPIFNLKNYRQDLKWFLNELEQIVIDSLENFGVSTHRHELNTGVWIESQKICSMGIGVKKWVTYHGLGLNINNQLNDFFSFSQ